jgi:hypothetical protein
MTEGNFRSNRWQAYDSPGASDVVQLCCRGAIFGEGDPDTKDGREFVRDLSKFSTLFKDADQLLLENGCRQEDGALNSELEGPEHRREHERELARQFAETRTTVRDNPKSFAELAVVDVLDRRPLIVDDELLASEAHDWIVRPMAIEQEFDRLPTLAWLKSGQSLDDFSRRHAPIKDRVRSYTAALAVRLNKERVPVKSVVWRLNYKKDILQGVDEIARSLQLSARNVQAKIDDGLVPVATVGGTIIASEKMIRHLRKHYSSPERARSQVECD